MNYPDPSFGQQPSQPAGQEGGYGQPRAGYGAGQPQQFHGPQFAGQQGRPYAQRKPSPLAAAGMGTWLSIGIAATALLAWLLSLFAEETVAVDYSLAGGVLALLTLLPSNEKLKVPNVLPFAGVLSVLGALMVIRQAVLAGTGSPQGLAVVVMVLFLLQAIVAAAAVLLHYGVIKPSAPRPPMPPQAPVAQQQWNPGSQQYGPPSAGNQALGAPQAGTTPSGATPSGSGSAPASSATPSTGAQAGHFDPAQFGAPPAPHSATKQFNRPSDPPNGFSS